MSKRDDLKIVTFAERYGSSGAIKPLKKFEARVETTDHLDWVDVSTNQDSGGHHDAWSTLSVRGLGQLEDLYREIGNYLIDHGVEVCGE